MAPEDIATVLDVQSKGNMNLEDESDDEERSKSPTNTKNDKLRKSTHSEIERRRREKMNRYIDEIAQLLPMDAVKKLDKLTVLRVAVDTIKHLKGTTSKVSSSGFGKQTYLSDNELLELILATIDQLGTYFFLIIECQKGRICYASSSTETILGYKPNELCQQTIFDIIYQDDVEVVKQQLMNEKRSSSTSSEDLTTDSRSIPFIATRQNCLEAGNRRKFSCRIKSKTKRSNKTTTTTTTANPTDNYIVIDFAGYVKQYSLTSDNQNETKIRSDRRHSSFNALTPADVSNAIGTNPVSCLIAMGNVCKRIEITNQNVNAIDRMFLCKLNPDGQFTYFDQICYSLLGYVSQDLLGMNLKDFIHEDDRTKINEIWNRVCRDCHIVTSGNYRFRTYDNSYIILQTIFEPFINPWNNEIEIIVARNKIKTQPFRMTTSNCNNSDNPKRVDMDTSSSTLDSNELIRQLLP